MAASSIAVRQEGAVLGISLARPEVRNALSLELMTEVTEALRRVSDETRVVVISAEGPAFSAGHDLGEMLDQSEAFYTDLFDVCTEMMLAIQGLPQPVLARVQGVATAAGCQLVASCDLAVAGESAWFATPGVKIGLFCSTPAVPLVRVIGRRRAMDMLLTGRAIDAHTAMSWGLVNQVVPDDRLDEAVAEYVGAITGFSGRVIALGKETFYRQADVGLVDAYRVASSVMVDNAALPHAQEGMGAFLEKREPEWPD